MLHPNSAVFSAPARRAVREGELRHALALLGVHIKPLLLPWRRDPHPDYRASYLLAQAALAAPRQLEYMAWDWQRAAPAGLPQPAD